jgi:hypothetical protein
VTSDGIGNEKELGVMPVYTSQRRGSVCDVHVHHEKELANKARWKFNMEVCITKTYLEQVLSNSVTGACVGIPNAFATYISTKI